MRRSNANLDAECALGACCKLARMVARMRVATFFAALTTAGALAGCSALPMDAAGSFNDAAGGTLLVGVSPHDPYTRVDTASGEVSGPEAELIRRFAEEIDAEVHWQVAPESEVAQWMEDGDIDVAIGGFAKDSPWTTHMALTRPYDDEDHVMAVGLGENKMLVELERFLDREAGAQ